MASAVVMIMIEWTEIQEEAGSQTGFKRPEITSGQVPSMWREIFHFRNHNISNHSYQPWYMRSYVSIIVFGITGLPQFPEFFLCVSPKKSGEIFFFDFGFSIDF